MGAHCPRILQIARRDSQILAGPAPAEMAKAARNLGISERQMGLRIKKFGIDYRRLRQTNGAGSEVRLFAQPGQTTTTE